MTTKIETAVENLGLEDLQRELGQLNAAMLEFRGRLNELSKHSDDPATQRVQQMFWGNFHATGNGESHGIRGDQGTLVLNRFESIAGNYEMRMQDHTTIIRSGDPDVYLDSNKNRAVCGIPGEPAHIMRIDGDEVKDVTPEGIFVYTAAAQNADSKAYNDAIPLQYEYGEEVRRRNTGIINQARGLIGRIIPAIGFSPLQEPKVSRSKPTLESHERAISVVREMDKGVRAAVSTIDAWLKR